MKAMIFAAGLGTRLKPFTATMPKALVPVAGMPMLEILIKHFQKNGINDIIINVHHFSDQVIGFLALNNNFGAKISISDESDLLLDTGGGLKKAAWFFDDKNPFLVQNVDVISDINYQEMLDMQSQSGSFATLAVSDRVSSRYFLFDERMQLCGWENTKTGELKIVNHNFQNLKRYAFSGIHVIDPEIFNFIKKEGKFSIVDTYLNIATTHKITCFEHNPENWVDMGKPEELLKAQTILQKLRSKK
jgi:NDP-sugar pyrophosphorylase family protein